MKLVERRGVLECVRGTCVGIRGEGLGHCWLWYVVQQQQQQEEEEEGNAACCTYVSSSLNTRGPLKAQTQPRWQLQGGIYRNSNLDYTQAFTSTVRHPMSTSAGMAVCFVDLVIEHTVFKQDVAVSLKDLVSEQLSCLKPGVAVCFKT